MEQLAQLKSPSAFTFFLNDEMQKISLAIARVNMAITKADSELTNQKAKQEFTTGCVELIDQLQTLAQNIKAASGGFDNKNKLSETAENVADTATTDKPTEK